MKDDGIGGLEARRAPPALQLDAVKPAHLAAAASAASEPMAGSREKTSKWNTKNLGLRLGADLVSAASAAVLVAPIISIIDRCAYPPSPEVTTITIPILTHLALPTAQ